MPTPISEGEPPAGVEEVDSPSEQAFGVRSPLKATAARHKDTYIVSSFIPDDEAAAADAKSPLSQGTMPDMSDDEAEHPDEEASFAKSAPLEPIASPIRNVVDTLRAPDGLVSVRRPDEARTAWNSELIEGDLLTLQDGPSVVGWLGHPDWEFPVQGALENQQVSGVEVSSLELMPPSSEQNASKREQDSNEMPEQDDQSEAARSWEDGSVSSVQLRLETHHLAQDPSCARGFEVGVRARVRSLTTFPEYNGRIGTIVKLLPEAAGEGGLEVTKLSDSHDEKSRVCVLTLAQTLCSEG